jgi:hypothetical protein
MDEVQVFNNPESVEMVEKTFLERSRGSTVPVTIGNLHGEVVHH